VILTDDLQIHLLQLSKLRVTAENVYHASPVERWAYFMKHAEYLTDTDIGCLFPDQEFCEAAGVLQMISRTPDVRMHYNAREKFLRDQDSNLRGALQQGIEQGRQEGRILLLQQLLGLTQSTAEEFATSNESQLAELEEQLHRQMQSRSQQH
jgi:predicted transposase/invertase (TIGR01784 family)